VTTATIEAPSVEDGDVQQDVSNKNDEQCRRLINGLHAIPRHCRQCDGRIFSARPREYRHRDYLGRVIVADWIDASEWA
jgi:hypothetical protein